MISRLRAWKRVDSLIGRVEQPDSLSVDVEGAYRWGLTDGYQDGELARGIDATGHGVGVDALSNEPIELLQRIADEQVRLKGSEVAITRLEAKVVSDKAGLEEAARRLADLKARWSAELDRLAELVHQTSDKVTGVVTASTTTHLPVEVPEKSSEFMIFNGMFYLGCALMFAVADISLAAKVSEAMGFARPSGYGTGIFKLLNVSMGALLLGLGIAALTGVFKLAFDRFYYPYRRLPRGNWVLVLSVGVAALTAITSVALVRAYALGSGQTFAGWAWFLLAITFPMAGGLCMAEGLYWIQRALSMQSRQRFVRSLAGSVTKSMLGAGESVNDARDAERCAGLENLIGQVTEETNNRVKDLHDAEKLLDEQVVSRERSVRTLEVLNTELSAIRSYWDALAIADPKLYEMGHDFGSLLKARGRPFAWALHALSDEMNGQVNGSGNGKADASH